MQSLRLLSFLILFTNNFVDNVSSVDSVNGYALLEESGLKAEVAYLKLTINDITNGKISFPGPRGLHGQKGAVGDRGSRGNDLGHNHTAMLHIGSKVSELHSLKLSILEKLQKLKNDMLLIQHVSGIEESLNRHIFKYSSNLANFTQKGDLGALGEEGNRGFPGLDGLKGETGLPSLDGTPGPKGLAGDSGEAGPIGHDGVAGPPGQKGEKGYTGLPGPIGIPGESKGQAPRGEKGAA